MQIGLPTQTPGFSQISTTRTSIFASTIRCANALSWACTNIVSSVMLDVLSTAMMMSAGGGTLSAISSNPAQASPGINVPPEGVPGVAAVPGPAAGGVGSSVV